MRISLFTSYNKQERINLWGIIMIKTLFKHISKYYKDTFVLAIAGVAVGVLVGLVDAAFGLGLNTCTAYPDEILLVSDLVPASWRRLHLVHLSPVWQICRQWYEDGLSRRPW